MPQADIKYSNDLNLDCTAILASIEETIKKHDQSSGACKGRAYKADHFHHTHIYVNLAMLPKPHRDKEFTKTLISDLEKMVKQHLTQSCHFSLNLEYTGEGYITNFHDV
mgnify:CR=1 FL=1